MGIETYEKEGNILRCLTFIYLEEAFNNVCPPPPPPLGLRARHLLMAMTNNVNLYTTF